MSYCTEVLAFSAIAHTFEVSKPTVFKRNPMLFKVLNKIRPVSLCIFSFLVVGAFSFSPVVAQSDTSVAEQRMSERDLAESLNRGCLFDRHFVSYDELSHSTLCYLPSEETFRIYVYPNKYARQTSAGIVVTFTSDQDYISTIIPEYGENTRVWYVDGKLADIYGDIDVVQDNAMPLTIMTMRAVEYRAEIRRSMQPTSAF